MQNEIWRKYTEITQISSNNYSIIYKAKDKSKNTDVIIKEIDLNKYSLYKHESFKIENLNKIKTENTVNIFESYKIDDKYYIIMEKCENFESYVKKPFSPEKIRN